MKINPGVQPGPPGGPVGVIVANKFTMMTQPATCSQVDFKYLNEKHGKLNDMTTERNKIWEALENHTISQRFLKYTLALKKSQKAVISAMLTSEKNAVFLLFFRPDEFGVRLIECQWVNFSETCIFRGQKSRNVRCSFFRRYCQLCKVVCLVQCRKNTCFFRLFSLCQSKGILPNGV